MLTQEVQGFPNFALPIGRIGNPLPHGATTAPKMGYPSSHKGSVENGCVSNISFLSVRVVFYFHDYGRKSIHRVFPMVERFQSSHFGEIGFSFPAPRKEGVDFPQESDANEWYTKNGNFADPILNDQGLLILQDTITHITLIWANFYIS